MGLCLFARSCSAPGMPNIGRGSARMEPVTSYESMLIQFSLTLIVMTGGFRFREWAVAGRERQPRFSHTTETVLCWLIYSLVVSFVVFWGRQSVFALQQVAGAGAS